MTKKEITEYAQKYGIDNPKTAKFIHLLVKKIKKLEEAVKKLKDSSK